jgi:hypothetical protein
MKTASDIHQSPLEWENYVVLQAVQALLGLVTPRVRAVSVRANPDLVTLFFAMDKCELVDQQDIDDAGFELDVLLDGKPRIDSSIHVGVDDEAWDGFPHRRIYRAKPDQPAQTMEMT